MNSYFNMLFHKLQLTVTIPQCASTPVITAAAQGMKGQWINREESGIAAHSCWSQYLNYTSTAVSTVLKTHFLPKQESFNSMLLPFRNTWGKMSLFLIVSVQMSCFASYRSSSSSSKLRTALSIRAERWLSTSLSVHSSWLGNHSFKERKRKKTKARTHTQNL